MNIAPLGISERSPDMHQLVLLAMNRQGYHNLSELVSLGWIDGFFYEPRVDIEMIRQYQEGIICLTGAGNDGFLHRHLQVGANEEAERQAHASSAIFLVTASISNLPHMIAISIRSTA